MRDERAGGGAAVHHLQHGGLDLDVAALAERLAHGGVDLRAVEDVLARLVAHDEVEVPAADAGLVRELRVQVRQGQQGLRGDAPLGAHDRQLALAARDDAAGDEDVVAEVDELLPRGERLVAHLGQRDHGLDAGSVARLERGEAELAGVAEVDDAAGDADHVVGLLAGLEVAELGADRGDRGRDGHLHRVRALAGAALGVEAGALGEAHGLLLGDVLGGSLHGGSWGGLGRRGRSGAVGHVRADPRGSWVLGGRAASRRFSQVRAGPGHARGSDARRVRR